MRGTAAKGMSHRDPCIFTLVFGTVQALALAKAGALTTRDLSLEMLSLLLTSLLSGLALEHPAGQ
jgi:hypothetical protein